MDWRFPSWLGAAIVATVFLFSLAVSVYHVRIHETQLLLSIVGQWSLVVLSLTFGCIGYYALANVDAPNGVGIIGRYTVAGYVLAGLSSGGYASHQYLVPEATIEFDVILFQAIFVALVGGIAGVIVGFETARRKRSIADLEAIEDEIRTEKRRFESLFQNAPSAAADIQYADGEPTIDRANAVFEDLVDHTSADAQGKNLFEVVPLRETETEAAVATHVAENEIYRDEVTVDRPDGRGHYKLRVIPYEVGKEGERAFALYTDVTELRRTQQELAESVDQLEASNERLEQFAYAVSHDLQEPLRMVSSYLQLLEDRYRADLDEEAEEFIDFAVDGADRMRAMIENLLEYSRVTTRGDPLEPTDAAAVLDDVLTDLEPRIEETDATITVDELPTVTADGDQLAQVFRNLLSNALKYSGDEPPQVHVGVERTGDEWRFAIADQGIGIDSEQSERIFDVFETAHTSEEGSDSGIGLALCQRIVERHGGKIWVDSEPDEGATFYFTLPRTEARESARTRPPRADSEEPPDSRP
ncbi:PAS domain-containing protein [Haloterrigena sp. SYSU A558-1]|uniref:histidine kinase n=1 Tax=Haloterrigena gelatinilytica TaxID=2741724 RepID=A0A8J8GNP0_9EURY|nr:ATP-binding protein [Haloterrigena gelatinilytica]NUB93036.1 PAS domain-containing protein [Haloterrigena gelatinilytica]NUC71054.1 PAS domain-containing protein [Haloterrigena gelatinilytica]